MISILIKDLREDAVIHGNAEAASPERRRSAGRGHLLCSGDRK